LRARTVATAASDRASQEDYARGQLGPGLLWRFGTPKGGWGFHWGLNWYAVKLERPIGGNVTGTYCEN
jgi:hypothetical protein